MRSSTLFFAASVFAIASPALASRRGSAYSRDETSALYQREDMDLLARELM